MRTALSLAGMVALTGLLAGCGGSEPEPVAPPPDTATVEKGSELFQAQCMTCHGPGGEGDGPAAAGLRVKPRNLKSEPYKYVDVAGASSEVEALVAYIRQGRVENGMPPFGHLPTEDLRSLAKFVESIRPESVAPPTGGAEAAPGGG